MPANYTDRLCGVLRCARDEAEASGSDAICTRHLLLAILGTDYGLTLQTLHLPAPEPIVAALKGAGGRPKNSNVKLRFDLPLAKDARQALMYAVEECDTLGHSLTDTEHLLLGILRDDRSDAAAVLRARGMTIERMRAEVSRRIARRWFRREAPNGQQCQPAMEADLEKRLQALPESRRHAAGEILQALSQPRVHVAVVDPRNVMSISFAGPSASKGPSAASVEAKHGGRDWGGLLTRRETEVLWLIGRGKTSKEISEILSISEATVGNHRKQLCRKLNVHTTAELAAFAARCSWSSFQVNKRR
jgi:DNA-binding CsgD family transcriptional regulator